MARFPSIDETGAFEAPEVQNKIKELVTGTTDGITVDTTVGTRVYVGDTMIYGDTGWRDVSHLLADDWDKGAECTIKREGNTVTLLITTTWVSEPRSTSSVHVLSTIAGFRPPGFRTIGNGLRKDSGGTILNSGMIGQYSTGSLITFYEYGEANWEPGNRIDIAASWTTTNLWPTSLPGLPA